MSAKLIYLKHQKEMDSQLIKLYKLIQSDKKELSNLSNLFGISQDGVKRKFERNSFSNEYLKILSSNYEFDAKPYLDSKEKLQDYAVSLIDKLKVNFKLQVLANQLEISYPGIRKKIDDKNFKVEEIDKLEDLIERFIS